MPRKTDSNNPADWLFFAREDIDAVRLLAEREISFHLCQSKLAEALEKTLKAELIAKGWFLEKVHDLQKLIDELTELGSDIVEAAQPLAESLAEAYFSERYPGFDLEDPDWPGFREKLGKVGDVFETVAAPFDI
ncbi:MAG: HEPN domain-containing protein [Lentisphaerae bacterium]|nr:HEPN domain-containing protein [Lentisphaerota bacterium]